MDLISQNRNKQVNSLGKFLVKKEENAILLSADNIYYLYSFEGKVIIVTKDYKYESWDALKIWEKRLSECKFLRCHRSYLVNIEKIYCIEPWINDSYNLKLNDIPDNVYCTKSNYNILKNQLNI